MTDDLPHLDTLRVALTPLAGLTELGPWEDLDHLGQPGGTTLVTFPDGVRVRISLNTEVVFLDAPVADAPHDLPRLLAVLEANTTAPYKFRLEPVNRPEQTPVIALEGYLPRTEELDLLVLVWALWSTVHWRSYLFQDLWEA